MSGISTSTPLDNIAHIVQTALTPVFLLTGVATLLNTLATRLGRVSDLMQRISERLDTAPTGSSDAKLLYRRLSWLQRRNAVLIAAMVSGTTAGAATCGAILVLFVGALRDQGRAAVLFAFFGVAVLCTTGTLIGFLAETVLAWHGLRGDADQARARHYDL